jgi:hypothetical protein
MVNELLIPLTPLLTPSLLDEILKVKKMTLFAVRGHLMHPV